MAEQQHEDESEMQIRSVATLPPLATPGEVALALRCTKRYIQAEVAAGNLRAALIAGRYLITPQAVTAYIREQLVCPKETKERGSNGGKIEKTGKSSGLNAANDAAIAQAQEIAERLIKSSGNGSSAKKRNQSAQVIPLSAGYQMP